MLHPFFVASSEDFIIAPCLSSAQKNAHVSVLQLQKLHLFINTSGISRKAAVRADDPVAGNDDRYRIVPHRTADGLRGHSGKLLFFCEFARDLAVGCGLSVGNL